MSTLTLELPDEVLDIILDEADRRGLSAQRVAEEWLIERTAVRPSAQTDRERLQRILRDHGLLVESDPLHAIPEPALSMDEIREAMQRAGGRPLSEIVIEQRGPKA